MLIYKNSNFLVNDYTYKIRSEKEMIPYRLLIRKFKAS